MKRSEILSEIEKYVKAGIGANGKSLYPPDMIAERVLEAIEEAGMLPPYDPASDDEHPIYDWEPEDE